LLGPDPSGHASTVYDVELAPGYVLSAGGDGAVIRWPIVPLPDRAGLREAVRALTDVRITSAAGR
jgi:hypothetical protein